jgi:uncharacterized protein YutE (UPF0331/DUF86 family)
VVNVQKLQSQLDNLRAYVRQLREIAQTEREAFLKDDVIVGGAKYYLQSSISVCLDIGNHIIASEGYRAPKDYRDIFTVMNENGVLPDDFTRTLRQMAGLRNRLVHLYWEVDDEQIYDDLQNHLGDFDKYADYIVEFVKGREK